MCSHGGAPNKDQPDDLEALCASRSHVRTKDLVAIIQPCASTRGSGRTAVDTVRNILGLP